MYLKNSLLMNKNIMATGAIFGILAVILGAFGAHALKKMLDFQQLNTFETGVRYQMYHALFLLFLGLVPGLTEGKKKVIYYFILFGVILFSGSIYLLATNNLTAFNFNVIGFVTPIGGLLLIIGWGLVLLSFLNKKSQNA